MTTTSTSWFVADKEGMGEQTARRDPGFVIYELFQNAADEDTTEIRIDLTVSARGRAVLRCEDNSPGGFEDLADSFTLFKRSKKADDPTRRGRFNSGEKYVLARCESAVIESTTGVVEFNPDGTRSMSSRRKRDSGSVFSAVIRMTRDEVDQAVAAAFRIIVPAGIHFFMNGVSVAHRNPVMTIAAKGLQTEADFRPTRRNTTIDLYQPESDETALIYELGIPVVEHDGRFHIDVQQCVPLNSDRDNVTPAYLRTLHSLVLDNAVGLLTEEDANSSWVKTALPEVAPEVASEVFTKRFGEKTAIADPSDPEATKRLIEEGYTILSGRSLSKDEWSALRRADSFKPAGQIRPSGVQFGAGGKPPISEADWTPGMARVAGYAKALAKELLGFEPRVSIYNLAPGSGWAGCWGDNHLSFNVGSLGHRWFNEPDQRKVDELLIHEFSHVRAHDHLTDQFHRECCRLGAALRHCTARLDP